VHLVDHRLRETFSTSVREDKISHLEVPENCSK